MKININKFKFKKIYEMNQTVEQIIQDLKKNINHPLFKDQMEIILRDEYKYRKSIIKSEMNKIRKSFQDQLTRCIGSIVSFIFAIIWFLIVFPFKLIELFIMIIKVPYQCKEHDKLVNMVQNHPDFIKIKSGKKC